MMKTRKYIAVIFAAMVMGISGCNDDLFLEEHPDTFYTAEDAFKTVDQVKACVTNMYAHARYWLQNDVFLKGQVLICLIPRCGGQAVTGCLISLRGPRIKMK